ncbi:FkbM family methyltransferase [Roseobacter sp.]|uniref:FkbM family methyltransferase n=1 Tax=Roseobacter sp. TaxID=1907202 RepID=UPI00385FB15C
MTQETDLAAAQDALAKLKRRQKRNQRAAFAKGLMQGICSMLKPGDVALDCGANVGDVTLMLAQTGADVQAFEPDPYAFARLTAATQGIGNLTLHPVAVGVAEGTVRLMRADNFGDNPAGASVKSTVVSGGRKIDEAAQNAIEVSQISLLDHIDALCETHGEIAFLKMDIEGAELDLLEEMLKRGTFQKVRLTVVETHENKFKDLRPRFADLRAAVAKAYPITRVNLDWI